MLRGSKSWPRFHQSGTAIAITNKGFGLSNQDSGLMPNANPTPPENLRLGIVLTVLGFLCVAIMSAFRQGRFGVGFGRSPGFLSKCHKPAAASALGALDGRGGFENPAPRASFRPGNCRAAVAVFFLPGRQQHFAAGRRLAGERRAPVHSFRCLDLAEDSESRESCGWASASVFWASS